MLMADGSPEPGIPCVPSRAGSVADRGVIA
jgi:hypothetical protein